MILTDREQTDVRFLVATGEIPDTIRVASFKLLPIRDPYYAVSFGPWATWLLTAPMLDDLVAMCQEAKAAVPDE